jgi:PBP1b-binding outer membrane lipoprotein LpoB
MKKLAYSALLCALLLAGCASKKEAASQARLERGAQRNEQAQQDMNRAFDKP